MLHASTPHYVIIGAGMGGLTAAALLLKHGMRVTVLEAHIYPGGSAGTFFHQGYRFDAGATLAGGFAPGAPHARIAEWLGIEWPIQPTDPAWVVVLGDRTVTQWSDRDQWRAERQVQFPGSESFWQAQEWLADQAWQVSAGDFPFPPQSLHDLASLLRALTPQMLAAAPFGLRRMVHLLPRHADRLLYAFVDAQLIISAQTTARYANALYGSAALDLPRRGVNQVRGGIGGLAQTLADWIVNHGGQILYRQPVERIITRNGRAIGVRTAKGLTLEADGVVANLTPWGLARVLGDEAPLRLRREIQHRPPGWGAFTLYLGLQADLLSDLRADHYQVVVDPAQPMGEGNSVFISLSAADDPQRAPAGMRAATLSTHTRVQDWWTTDDDYASRREAYTQLLLRAAEMVIPGIRAAVRFQLPGTPKSFEYFTRRPMGMVGGFAQTSLLRARGPWSGLPNAWLVGDSVFPGQSTAGVTLGAIRVVVDILKHHAPAKGWKGLSWVTKQQIGST